MGKRPYLAPPQARVPHTALRPIAAWRRRVGGLLIAVAATSLFASCLGLPDPYLDPEGQETIHSVVEMAPGWWHVLVRVNYFSSEEAAERVLRERVTGLCPDSDLVLENLQVVGVPRIATADVHCAGEEPPPDTATAPLSDDQVNGAPEGASQGEEPGDTGPALPSPDDPSAEADQGEHAADTQPAAP